MHAVYTKNLGLKKKKDLLTTQEITQSFLLPLNVYHKHPTETSYVAAYKYLDVFLVINKHPSIDGCIQQPGVA